MRCAARTRDARRRCRRRSALTPGGFASAAGASTRERLRWATSGRCAAPVIDSAAVLGGVPECGLILRGRSLECLHLAARTRKRLCLVSERLRQARERSCRRFVPFGPGNSSCRRRGRRKTSSKLPHLCVSGRRRANSSRYAPSRSPSSAPGNAKPRPAPKAQAAQTKKIAQRTTAGTE